jgi:flagellar motor switch protein FliN
MATVPQLAQDALPGSQRREAATEAALVRSPAELIDRLDAFAAVSAVSRIPIEIDVAVPVRGFRVASLLTLAEGHVIESQWLEGGDMPLGARGAQLAWAEFEVIDEKLAVRITRLA